MFYFVLFHFYFLCFLFFSVQTMSLWPSLSIGYNNIGYFVIVLSTAVLFDTAAAYCPERSWWDQSADACVPCTLCEDQTIVLRPCQLHIDTVCGTLQDLEIDWSYLGDAQRRVVAPGWEEVRSMLEKQGRTSNIKGNNKNH